MPPAALRDLFEDHLEQMQHPQAKSAPLKLSKTLQTYHEDEKAKYCLPNDTIEHSRLEAQASHLSNLMNGQVLHAPIKDDSNCYMLDVGCGTGSVTDLMARRFSQAQCIGLDLSPVPAIRSHSSNTHFYRGNVLTQKPSEWTPNSKSQALSQNEAVFDYIFSRLLILGISDWPAFFRQEFQLLKPGGWVEAHDISWDWYDKCDTIISGKWFWLQQLSKVLEKQSGLDFHCGSRAKQRMEDAGFVDVQVVKYYWPFGEQDDPAKVVHGLQEYLVDFFPNTLQTLIEHTLDDHTGSADNKRLVKQVSENMRECLRPEKGKHQWFYVTFGRKPFDHGEDHKTAEQCVAERRWTFAEMKSWFQKLRFLLSRMFSGRSTS